MSLQLPWNFNLPQHMLVVNCGILYICAGIIHYIINTVYQELLIIAFDKTAWLGDHFLFISLMIALFVTGVSLNVHARLYLGI